MKRAERPIEAAAHHGPVIATMDGRDVIECEACGFRHIDPLFTDEQLKKFYDADFYQKEKPNYFRRAEEDKEWWMLRYRRYYELLEAHVLESMQVRHGHGLNEHLLVGQVGTFTNETRHNGIQQFFHLFHAVA